jgi:glycosyltransferase involved in cell wall biosynthesis
MVNRLVWFGGFPAHYMAQFHTRLESEYEGVHFVYVPLGQRGSDFSHEQIALPKNSTILSSKTSYLEAWKILNTLNPHALVISGNYPRPNLIAAIWAKYKRRPLYYLSDSNVFDAKNTSRVFFNRIILKRLLLSANKLLYIGKNNQSFYIDICGLLALESKLQFFPLPHPCDAFEATSHQSDQKFKFLVLGRLVDVKAVNHVIEAISLLDEGDKQKCQLVIAGDGPVKSSLEQLTNQLNLNRYVTFLGSIPSTQAPQIFSQADVVIVPSHQEPWGLVVNEALSSAKPVIVPYWVGSCVDLVVDHQTGIVMKDNSPESIAVAMKFFIDDFDQARKMGMAGRQLIRDGGWHIHRSVEVFGQILAEINRSGN